MLFIISPPAHLNLEDKLSRITDVIKIQLFGENLNIWQNLEQLTREVGELSGQQRQSSKILIDSVEARISEIAAQIKRPAEPLFIAEILDDRHLRLYGAGSLEGMRSHSAWLGECLARLLLTTGALVSLTISEAFQIRRQKVHSASPGLLLNT